MVLEKVIVTDRGDKEELKSSPVFTTPGDNAPNIQVVQMSAVKQTLIRGLRTFVQTLVPTLAAVATGAPQAAITEVLKYMDLPIPEHKGLIVLLAVSLIPASTAATALLQNAAELLAKLDNSNPELRA